MFAVGRALGGAGEGAPERLDGVVVGGGSWPAAGCRSATTGLRRWHQPRTAAWLRNLLITCQILPDADRALLNIEAWLEERLEALAGHPHQRLLRQYALWQLLPKLRAKAQQRPLPPTAYQNARQQFTSAANFCTWLAEQQATDIRPQPA